MSDNTLVDAEMSLVNGVEGLAPAGVNVLLNNPVTDAFERHLLGYVNSFAGKSASDLLQHLGSTVGALEAKLPDFAKPLAKEFADRIQAALSPAVDTPSTPADTAPSAGVHLTAAQVVKLSKLSAAELSALIGA